MNTLAQVLAHKQDYENAERLCRRACQLRSDAGVAGRYEEGRQTEPRALALVNVETHPDELLRAAILRNVGNAAAGGKVQDALGYFAQSEQRFQHLQAKQRCAKQRCG